MKSNDWQKNLSPSQVKKVKAVLSHAEEIVCAQVLAGKTNGNGRRLPKMLRVTYDFNGKRQTSTFSEKVNGFTTW